MSEASRSKGNTRWGRAVLGSVPLAATLLPGCGGGGGGGGTPTQPSTPVRTVILQRVWTLVVGQFVAFEGPISGSGTLEATVEWTLATNDVDIYVTTDACSEQTFALFQCTFLASADSATTKPEHVSLSVTAGAYRVWVVNLGPTEEAGTVEVAITQ